MTIFLFLSFSAISTKQPIYKQEEIIPNYEESHTKHNTDPGDCPCALNQPKKDNSRMINPIYIAVPVAGVCVLLALIIFAMYLLRRRNVYYERYQYPRTVPAHAPQNVNHCSAENNKCATSCKINRCTDSERSSSGSESKLFIWLSRAIIQIVLILLFNYNTCIVIYFMPPYWIMGGTLLLSRLFVCQTTISSCFIDVNFNLPQNFKYNNIIR